MAKKGIDLSDGIVLREGKKNGFQVYEVTIPPQRLGKLFEDYDRLNRSIQENYGLLETWGSGYLEGPNLNQLRAFGVTQADLEKIFHLGGLVVERYAVARESGHISIVRTFLLPNKELFSVALQNNNLFSWFPLDAVELFNDAPDVISYGKPIPKFIPTQFGSLHTHNPNARIVNELTYQRFPIETEGYLGGYRADYFAKENYFALNFHVSKTNAEGIKSDLLESLDYFDSTNQHRSEKPPKFLHLNEFFPAFTESIQKRIADLKDQRRKCEEELREANEQAKQFIYEFAKRGFDFPEAEAVKKEG